MSHARDPRPSPPPRQGGEHWASRRDEWIEAVRAAPTAALVKTLQWMGVTTLEREAEPAAHVIAEGDVVLIEGVEKKPALNGKYVPRLIH